MWHFTYIRGNVIYVHYHNTQIAYVPHLSLFLSLLFGDVYHLQSFMDPVNQFIPELATIKHPLNNLLRQDTRWNQSDESEAEFCKVKEQLLSWSTTI